MYSVARYDTIAPMFLYIQITSCNRLFALCRDWGFDSTMFWQIHKSYSDQLDLSLPGLESFRRACIYVLSCKSYYEQIHTVAAQMNFSFITPHSWIRIVKLRICLIKRSPFYNYWQKMARIVAPFIKDIVYFYQLTIGNTGRV